MIRYSLMMCLLLFWTLRYLYFFFFFPSSSPQSCLSFALKPLDRFPKCAATSAGANAELNSQWSKSPPTRQTSLSPYPFLPSFFPSFSSLSLLYYILPSSSLPNPSTLTHHRPHDTTPSLYRYPIGSKKRQLFLTSIYHPSPLIFLLFISYTINSINTSPSFLLSLLQGSLNTFLLCSCYQVIIACSAHVHCDSAKQLQPLPRIFSSGIAHYSSINAQILT